MTGECRARLDDIGSSKQDKKDSEGAKLTYLPVDDGRFMAFQDGEYQPVLVYTWWGGDGWTAFGGVPELSATAPTASPMPSTSGGQVDRRRRLASGSASSSPARKRFRPPEVLLSAEVYDELYRVQIAEKKVRRGLARTMGAIVLDAIEAHATRLATTWADQRFAVGEGQLFERPSSNAVPRRRRHATAPRTVVLSGVSAANGKRLDDLVQAWNAGTRSALVEQALRYEFAVLPEH